MKITNSLQPQYLNLRNLAQIARSNLRATYLRELFPSNKFIYTIINTAEISIFMKASVMFGTVDQNLSRNMDSQ